MTASIGLAAMLREGTRIAHERAESSAFVGALTGGRLPLSCYAALVAQNHAIYRALETHVDALREHRVVGRLAFAELVRLPSLEADLAALYGESWRAHAQVVPATNRYVAHLDEVLTTWPLALAAHHYVRYLGDLSGGQLLRRAVEAHYSTSATTFYVFRDIPRVKPFRDAYRATLDALPVSDADRARLVAEAVVAFDLNRAVFEDLGAAHGL